MTQYNVTGLQQCYGLDITVEASSPKDALLQVLKLKNIPFKDVIKMTTKENQKCYDNGIEPYTMVDFVVEKVGTLNPITGIGNYHVIK